MGLLSAIKSIRGNLRIARKHHSRKLRYRPSVELLAQRINPVTNTFNGTTNTDWFTAGNWSQGHFPTATEDVEIEA